LQTWASLQFSRVSGLVSGIDRLHAEGQKRIAAAQLVFADVLFSHVSQAVSAPTYIRGPTMNNGTGIGYASIFGWLNGGGPGAGGSKGTVSADLLGRPNDRRSPLKLQSPEECVISFFLQNHVFFDIDRFCVSGCLRLSPALHHCMMNLTRLPEQLPLAGRPTLQLEKATLGPHYT
jgi:hypothetical protein